MTVKKNNLKEYARINDVPIINDEGLNFILGKIDEFNIKTVLEIGTAIGFSAISFAEKDCLVTTIERNEAMYKQAIKNVNDFGFNEKIELIFDDALTTTKVSGMYDLIFIDAAKAQYEKFFNKYKVFLNEGGIIISDNLNFHNLDITKVSRNTRQLITKINRYKEFLKTNSEYETQFYDIGDGMSVSIKR